MTTKPLQLAGKKFRRLTAIKPFGHNTSGKRQWLCVCDCGTFVVVVGSHLKNGNTKSCGCLAKDLIAERSRTHGHSVARVISPTYHSWAGMKARCTNHAHNSYARYGGRGVTICDRWLDFDNFFADMGERPEGMTIERIDNNKGYSPDNCKWATGKEQGNNKSTNRLLTCRGMTLTVEEWAEITEIPSASIRARIDRLGWIVEEALGFINHDSPPRKIDSLTGKFTC